MKYLNNNLNSDLISGKKHKFRFHWWYILIAVVVVAVAAVSGVFIYINLHIQHPDQYASNWQQAQSNASDSISLSDPAVDEGLDSLDAGDFSKVERKDYPIIKVKPKSPAIENILIMGIDGGDPGGVGVNRADSIIVASINTKTNTLKLTSLLRDTKTYFPNTDSYHKLNAAYSYGGPGLQIDVINYAYHLDIQKYIQIDFSGFQKIIDAVGGVPITLTAQEASYSYIHVGTTAGVYNLDGTNALGYTRTRYIDTDFMRTQRQRNVILSLYNKFKDVGVATKLSTANQCLSFVQTNIPTAELLGKMLTFGSSVNGDIQQMEIPAEGDGMYTTETSPIWFWDLDWSREVAKLQAYIYGN